MARSLAATGQPAASSELERSNLTTGRTDLERQLLALVGEAAAVGSNDRH